MIRKVNLTHSSRCRLKYSIQLVQTIKPIADTPEAMQDIVEKITMSRISVRFPIPVKITIAATKTTRKKTESARTIIYLVLFFMILPHSFIFLQVYYIPKTTKSQLKSS